MRTYLKAIYNINRGGRTVNTEANLAYCGMYKYVPFVSAATHS
jgi:hypothetical protein